MNAPSLDVDGYLVDPSEWSENWARATADAMNLTLTDEHWQAIRFMRKFYDERQVAPDARFVMRHLSETRGAPRNRLFELFPFGYPGQACKCVVTPWPCENASAGRLKKVNRSRK